MMMYIYLSTLLVQIISVLCFVAADVLWDSGSQFPVHGDRAVECYRVSRPHTRITAARYPVGNVWLACKFCESFARRQAIQALEKEGA